MTKRLTHRERKQRRRLMASEVDDGKPIQEVAARYGVSPDTVYIACTEFKVILPNQSRGSRGSMTSFQVLKYLVDGHTEMDLVRRFNISRQYVNQIKQRAIAGGFTELLKLPQSRRKAVVEEPLPASEQPVEPIAEPSPDCATSRLQDRLDWLKQDGTTAEDHCQ